MRHLRALGFDALEARKLLTASHAAKHHTVPMIPATPIDLDGTLAVDNNAMTSTTNPDGSSTSSTPVVGRLGTLGKVRGVWNQGLDAFGDPTGVNALRLGTSKGSVIIVFDTVNAVKPLPAPHDAIYDARAQELYTGTGAYAGAVESGMIDMTTNSGRNQFVSLTLKSANT